MIVVGLMSGTSADGVDAAVVDIRGSGHRLKSSLLKHVGRSYSPRLRQLILQSCEHGTVGQICHLNVVLGEVFAKTALLAIKHSGLSPQRVALIGSHGQTIHHRPAAIYEPGIGQIRSTLQIGDPNVIAERTGITTVSDFRARDLSVGGEGAPLTPYVHALLFAQTRATRMVVNLGGIANVTVLPGGGNLAAVRAFDTGPCNMLLDGLVAIETQGQARFDRGGRLALKGHVDKGLLRWLLAHPYVSRRPPKSTGREMFGEDYIQRVWAQAQRRHLAFSDILATSSRFIAQVIHDSQKWTKEIPGELVLGGGGVRNARLWSELSGVFDPIPVRCMDECGTSSQAFEAQAFAVLAYQTIHGICANLPKVTGARHPVILGTVTPGIHGLP
ncbi:MAG: anhydro-N-acetylmuramic acid kinase [Nitrospirales bacterium]|nr:MAG: anhydro-N-acetylmuramic acid kinase [Nitrospirales bacterium]